MAESKRTTEATTDSISTHTIAESKKEQEPKTNGINTENMAKIERGDEYVTNVTKAQAMTEAKNYTEPATGGADVRAMTEVEKDHEPKSDRINTHTIDVSKDLLTPTTANKIPSTTTINSFPLLSPKTNDTNNTTPNTSPPPSPNPSKPSNAWTAPGPAAFDFRSDTVTSPTASMLAATAATTLLDDVFHEDPTTNELEEYVAGMVGKEAGVFVISGTMGNQLSVRTHIQGCPESLVADVRSHVIGWEAGGIASLSGAMPIPVTPSNGHHLILSDIITHTVTSSDQHYCPTRLICLENTLGGTIMPLKDCRKISEWAHAQSPPIAVHMDGARLWEAVAAGAGSLREYSECFDSVTMCFSKGLGAPIGSIICASAAFIKKARHLRKMMGGGLRMAGVVTGAARIAVDETFFGGHLAATHVRAKEVAAMWEEKGGKLAQPTETNMAWLDLDAAGSSIKEIVEIGVKEGLKLLGGRIVVHYQISEEAVARLGRVMDVVLSARKKKKESEQFTNGITEGAVLNTNEKELEEGDMSNGSKEDAVLNTKATELQTKEAVPITKEEKEKGGMSNGTKKDTVPATENKQVDLGEITSDVKEKAEENMAPEME